MTWSADMLLFDLLKLAFRASAKDFPGVKPVISFAGDFEMGGEVMVGSIRVLGTSTFPGGVWILFLAPFFPVVDRLVSTIFRCFRFLSGLTVRPSTSLPHTIPCRNVLGGKKPTVKIPLHKKKIL